MGKSALKHPIQVLIMVLSFLAVALFGASPVITVIAAALVGFLYFGYVHKKEESKKEGNV